MIFIFFFSIPELSSDTSRDAKSDTWPVVNIKKHHNTDEIKRRFSWENLNQIKESKRKSKRRSRKLFLPITFSAKKSPPKTKTTFKTSTPLKNANEKEAPSKVGANESSFGNSTTISQVTFNKATNSAQTTTCSDRLGVPKTSLNDFKRLLLNATNKKLTTKPSAVEQLKLKHESPMKILDLSSSPKSFMNRRVLQQTATSNSSSPYKKSNLMSPRSRKYSNFNKYSIASIPEANSECEDDITSNDGNTADTLTSKLKSEQKCMENMDEKANNSKANTFYATPQKNLVLCHEKSNDQTASISMPQTPITKMDSIEPIIAQTESSPETGIIETNFSMRENLFLQEEENNFMKGEIRSYGALLAKKPILKPMTDASQTSNDQTDVLQTSATPTLETSF